MAWRRDAVVQDYFYNKKERLMVQAEKRDKILVAHVQRTGSMQQIHGISRHDTTTSMENLKEQVSMCK